MIPLAGENGVRYTVPQFIHPSRMDEKLVVRFRVDNNYRDKYISVYYGDERISRAKKRILAPGEMEQVTLTRASLEEHPDTRNIRICLED